MRGSAGERSADLSRVLLTFRSIMPRSFFLRFLPAERHPFVSMFFWTTVLFTPPLSASAQIIHVDRDAPGPVHDGSSWCRAYTELYEALEIAPPGAMIHIAEGVYLPDASGLPDPRDATFTIPADLTIAGAYAGCGASDPDERDPFHYTTTLSGDLAGNDFAGDGTSGRDPGGTRADNVYHVVTAPEMSAPTTLSGLVIRGGHTEEGQGGGILASGGRLVLSVCTLAENDAWRGGAIYTENGWLHLFQCRFPSNSTGGEGGAIFDANSELEAHNCLFALNSAGSDGGAIFCDLCSADFLSCSFGGNTSQNRGGAIYDYVGVTTYAGNCIFWGNTDISGGGESAQLFINPSNILEIDYSCVQGWTGDFGGEGNIGEDPLLIALPAGDLHLLPDSPCIDRGSNDLVGSQLDLDGRPRIVNGTVDMGCYEYQGTSDVPDSRPDETIPRILSLTPRSGGAALRIRFRPPDDGAWSLEVYTVTGRRLVLLDRSTSPGEAGEIFRSSGGAARESLRSGADGEREISWNGRDRLGRSVPAGIYFFVLSRGDRVLDSRQAAWVR